MNAASPNYRAASLSAVVSRKSADSICDEA